MEGTRVPITIPKFLIGRDAQCHIRPASPLVSERHCVLLTREDGIFVMDLNSATGTFINDRRIARETKLRDGDRLKIGPLLFSLDIDSGLAAGAAEEEAANVFLDESEPASEVETKQVARAEAPTKSDPPVKPVPPMPPSPPSPPSPIHPILNKYKRRWDLRQT
jgi:pSer/pThr/pTyr-binding forkhead associated (FHA) protein